MVEKKLLREVATRLHYEGLVLQVVFGDRDGVGEGWSICVAFLDSLPGFRGGGIEALHVADDGAVACFGAIIIS